MDAKKKTTPDKLIKEVNLFTNGDSRQVSTWTNVPYLFAEALERKGIVVNRLDISQRGRVQKHYNGMIGALLDRYKPGVAVDETSVLDISECIAGLPGFVHEMARWDAYLKKHSLAAFNAQIERLLHL